MFVLFVPSLFPISQDISEATPYGLSYGANLCLFVLESAIQSSLSWRFNFRVLAFQNNQSNPAWPCPVSMAIRRFHCYLPGNFKDLQDAGSGFLLLFLLVCFVCFLLLLPLHYFCADSRSACDPKLFSYHWHVLWREGSVLFFTVSADRRLPQPCSGQLS